jgi:hypothetical protein
VSSQHEGIDWHHEAEVVAWMRFVDRLELERPVAWRLCFVPLRLSKIARNRARGVLKTVLRGSP